MFAFNVFLSFIFVWLLINHRQSDLDYEIVNLMEKRNMDVIDTIIVIRLS